MKKLSCFIVICFAFCFKPSAQVDLSFSSLIPTGDYYPYLLKPAWGIALNYTVNRPNDYISLGGEFGYYRFRPTQDTFITYAIGGNPAQLLPGWNVYTKYEIYQGGLTAKYTAFPDKKISPVVGFNFYFNLYYLSYSEYTQTVISGSTTNDDYFTYCIKPSLGVQYLISSKFTLSVGVALDKGFGGTIDSQTFWQPYISIEYHKDYHIQYHKN